MISWVERLRQAQAKHAAPSDPWLVRLERVRGQVGDDGIEPHQYATLLDHLQVLQGSTWTDGKGS